MLLSLLIWEGKRPSCFGWSNITKEKVSHIVCWFHLCRAQYTVYKNLKRFSAVFYLLWYGTKQNVMRFLNKWNLAKYCCTLKTSRYKQKNGWRAVKYPVQENRPTISYCTQNAMGVKTVLYCMLFAGWHQGSWLCQILYGYIPNSLSILHYRSELLIMPLIETLLYEFRFERTKQAFCWQRLRARSLIEDGRHRPVAWLMSTYI